MRIRVTRVAVAWVAALVWGVWLAQSTAAGEPDFVIVTPDEIQWRSVPSHDGLQVAFLAGNPAESGYYVMRVRFAAGVMSRPHSHDQDRYVTVIEGTWYAGTQAVFDPDATVALRAGSFMMHPAGAVHYDGAKAAPVIVEIRGLGPVATDYVAAPSAFPLEGVLRMDVLSWKRVYGRVTQMWVNPVNSGGSVHPAPARNRIEPGFNTGG